MGALYGILGAADHTELRALGDRLAHRGREAAEWWPGRDLYLGIRGARRIVDVQEHGPVAFDGAIDNRGEIARLLRRRDGAAVAPADDAESGRASCRERVCHQGADRTREPSKSQDPPC